MLNCDGTPALCALIDRMRCGDRAAAAEFMVQYGSLIRLRVRGRLGGALRRVFDSDDLLSTISRRLDGLVSAKRLRADTEPQLWALVAGIARRAISEQLSAAEADTDHLRPPGCLEGGRLSSAVAGGAGARVKHTMRLESMLGTLPDDVDRVMLLMRLGGATHVQIACAVGMSPGAVRMRWRRLRRAVRANERIVRDYATRASHAVQ